MKEMFIDGYKRKERERMCRKERDQKEEVKVIDLLTTIQMAITSIVK
jgi:hypothetical protein